MPSQAEKLADFWNQSYSRQENAILEPYEELVKFLSRYVWLADPESGEIVLRETFCSGDIRSTIVADIGCGVGGQSEYLSKKGLSVYGFDLSEIAVGRAKARTRSLKNPPEFAAVTAETVVFPKDISIAIACASLDSMPFSDAKLYMAKLKTVVRPQALFFATLIGESSSGPSTLEETVSNEEHEYGTVQSYFTVEKIGELLEAGGCEPIRIDKVTSVNLLPGRTLRSSSRYSVVGQF